MDLNWQIDIINGLIKENQDSTIKDCLELLMVLADIEQGYGNTNEIQQGDQAAGTGTSENTYGERSASIDRTIFRCVLSYSPGRSRMLSRPEERYSGGPGSGEGEGPIRPPRRETTRRKALTPHFETENKNIA